jgi:hypothetical protein
MENPYLPPVPLAQSQQPYQVPARLLRGGFLFRDIQFHYPFEFRFRYSGWNFIQRIRIDGQIVWRKISWIVIHRQAEFFVPESLDPAGLPYRMVIEFGFGLRMRRFQLLRGNAIIWEDLGDGTLTAISDV